MAGSMNCFPCFTSQKSKKSHSKREQGCTPQENVTAKTPDMKKQRPDDPKQVDSANIQAQSFTFRELATATKNFRQECLMGEGGFGRVYKGAIPATGQVVAVKQLDRNGMQGSKEFLVEVLTLSLLHHENLVNLIGYCADGDQRLLVYEFMSGGSLEDRLLENKRDQPPLDWFTRMKVAAGAARGLEYLHDTANPPVIYRDLKASNILLDNDLNAKLSDFGLAKLSGGDKMNPAPPRVMGTYGYCAPEYVRTGQLTLKSDVYSFGVVLLELITGRRAIDTTRPHEEQNLVSWAQPLFRDPKGFPDMADPLLNKHFPEKDLNQAVAIAAMCLQEEAEARPLMSDVVTALSFLSMVPPGVISASLPSATSVSKESAASEGEGEGESESESETESGSEAETGKESHGRDSFDDEDGKGSGHEDNKTAQNQGAASAKYQESDVSDIEDDYYKHENQHDSDSQEDIPGKEFYSKSSRKSSTRSRDGLIASSSRGSFSSESEDRSVSSSNKSSRKSHEVIGNLSQKSRRKSSVRDLSQQSSRKSSVRVRDLSYKSSRSSVTVLSHKTSMGSEDGSDSFEHCDSRASHGNASLGRNSSSVASEDGGVLFERSASRLSQGNISFGLISSESVHSDHSSSRRTEEGSIHLDNATSRGSDGESGLPFDHTSSSGSDEGSVHSR